jgi:ATP-binding cassette, subfamily B, bacterial
MSHPRVAGRAKHRPKAKKSTKQRSVFAILTSLRSLGLRSINRSLFWISSCSLVGGLSQAALLVIITELAATHAEGNSNLKIHGLSIPLHDSILVCIGLLILFFLFSMISASVTASMSSSAVEMGRDKIMDSYFKASWDIQSAERLGHVQQLLTVNCEYIAGLTQAISTGLQGTFGALALLLAAFIVNPVTASVVIVAGVVLSTVMRPILTLTRTASVRLSNDSARIATLATEYTRLAREFRLFGVEQEATDRLRQRNHEAAISYAKSRVLGQYNSVVYQTLALAFIIIGLALLLAHSGKNLGATGAILVLTLRSLVYGSAIQSSSQQIRSDEPFLDEVQAEVRHYQSSLPKFNGNRVPEHFDVKFDGVSFAYDSGTEAVKNVSFYIPSGKILGVVGRSGSGKSTLSQLVLGMRMPSHGHVFVGDVPASSIRKGKGTSPIALVAQESILLQGSIASNISFFRNVSQERIEIAARAAHLHEDVVAMPRSYETPVGEGGDALSGGQRQRLAIARALVGSPRVLVLDEPTSALDGRSESLVRRTLSELRDHVTVIVISHRLATVEDCDLLLVLDSGRLADFGPRDEVTGRAAFRHVAEATVIQSENSR